MYLAMAMAFLKEGQSSGAFLFQMLPFVFIFLIFYFLIIRPQIKQQKEHRKLVEDLKKGDKVVTNGGIWGEVDVVEPHVVRLKINDKTKILVSRNSISGPQPQIGEAESK